ncbi:MAG: DUF1972 domain-containing protein [Salibacteraceae bacterium]
MKIAILGTRGIPNHYGGFEQLAEYLSVGLVEKGHEVYVYNSHNHPYQKDTWNGVHLLHQNDPEHRYGTAGQFLYDLNCIRDSRKRKFDLILQLGYTSSSIWYFLFPKGTKIATNMDGLEWLRSKYRPSVQLFLQMAEWLAVRTSHGLISDSIGIKDYLKRKYFVDSTYIAYGADLANPQDPSLLEEWNLKPGEYDLLIARMEPENNVETILKGRRMADIHRPLIVIGGHEKTTHGKQWYAEYASESIRFLGAIYDLNKLDHLRHFSNLYFHGHSVGGTNPSLLEAMASNALICAHQNPFNASVLGTDAYYFSDEDEVSEVLNTVVKGEAEAPRIEANRTKITEKFNWPGIVDQYEAMMHQLVHS